MTEKQPQVNHEELGKVVDHLIKENRFVLDHLAKI